MSELADELARRMEPEHLKELAVDKVTELKGQARERATEKVDELKVRAKEAVMNRTDDIKQRADTPKGWSMLGAVIGAGVGSVLMKKVFDARHRSDGGLLSEDRYAYSEYDREDAALVPAPDGGLMRPTGDIRGMRGSDIGVRTSTDVGDVNTGESDLKSRASGAVDTAKVKASELKDRAGHLVDRAKDKAYGIRERIPDRGGMKHQASDLYSTLSDNPVLLAVGGIAIGALCASLLPVTNRERQLIEPAKAKVKERISEIGDQLESKLSGQSQNVGREDEYQASASSESERERGAIPPLPPLDPIH